MSVEKKRDVLSAAMMGIAGAIWFTGGTAIVWYCLVEVDTLWWITTTAILAAIAGLGYLCEAVRIYRKGWDR